jgi:hypothetical protein
MILHDVSLVCVSSVLHTKSVKSLLHCSSNITFNCIKFISDKIPDNFTDTIEFTKINPISSKDEYSKFILYELYKYITTDFCLIVQHDGFITNPTKWDSKFLEYDYIGAPWQIRDCYINQSGEQCRVGNGGFSLRSKKLLEMPSKLNAPFDIGEWRNEDLNFCIFNKDLYIKEGIKFAPIDVAKYFSHEMYTPELNNIIPFGVHGRTLQ